MGTVDSGAVDGQKVDCSGSGQSTWFSLPFNTPPLPLVEMYSNVQRQEVDPTPEHPNGRRTPPT